MQPIKGPAGKFLNIIHVPPGVEGDTLKYRPHNLLPAAGDGEIMNATPQGIAVHGAALTMKPRGKDEPACPRRGLGDDTVKGGVEVLVLFPLQCLRVQYVFYEIGETSTLHVLFVDALIPAGYGRGEGGDAVQYIRLLEGNDTLHPRRSADVEVSLEI